MCGRFTLTASDIEALARELSAELDRVLAAGWRPRYNAAPSDLHPVLRLEAGGRRLVAARFGFTGRDGKRIINARSETAGRLPMFRRPFQEGRCVVPVDGFYEWVAERGARRPRWLHPPEGGLLLLAGLWREEAGGAPAFAILTTPANEVVRGLHGRMPALLTDAEATAWLAAPDPSLLRPAPEERLVATPVSTRVNSVANDDPACLAPPEPEAQGRLL